jgi:dTDP-4-amino-4,6-dideoxygalactose transaminase
VITAGAGAGTEVICDSVFIFGALAALYNNAVPVFVDVNPVTHNMDPDKIEAAVTERTRAMIVTHAWGLPAEMDRIMEVARRHNLIVIEDCAHAILATYQGRKTGTLGHIGSFSFQASKQMSTGDGGMAVTDDDELARLLDLHAGAPTFLAVAHGLHFNYRMTELTAAVGLAQLAKLPGQIAALQAAAKWFDEAVEGCPWLVLQRGPEAAVHTYHLWVANFHGEKYGISRDDFLRVLRETGCGASVGYTNMPAYRHPVIAERLAHAFDCPQAAQRQYPDGLCPVAEDLVPRTVLVYTYAPEDGLKASAEALRKTIELLS